MVTTVSFSEDTNPGGVDLPSTWTHPQTHLFTVPAGVNYLRVTVAGGNGHEPEGGANNAGAKSRGGIVSIDRLIVTPGEVLQILFDGAGTSAPSNGGGYGGSAAAIVRDIGAGVYAPFSTQALVVGGGGGGNGGTNIALAPFGVGGHGGGTTGTTGSAGAGTGAGNPGTGGTPSAGGAGGTGAGGADGSPGALLNGGAGGGGAGTRNGGGGGGGWYGGGGGERGDTSTDGGGGGGGGSSYARAGTYLGSAAFYYGATDGNDDVAYVLIEYTANGGIFMDGAVHVA